MPAEIAPCTSRSASSAPVPVIAFSSWRIARAFWRSAEASVSSVLASVRMASRGLMDSAPCFFGRASMAAHLAVLAQEGIQ
jgi:hypothetical protein